MGTHFFFRALFFLVVARILLSWVPAAAGGPAGQAVFRITQPLFAIVAPLRLQIGPIDLSPIIIVLGLHFGEQLAIFGLRHFAALL